MQQEALEKLPEIRDELEACLLDILEDEPEGVRFHRVRSRIFRHPEYDVDANAKYVPAWTAELASDGVLVKDHPNKRLLHPQYADKEPEEYRASAGTNLENGEQDG